MSLELKTAIADEIKLMALNVLNHVDTDVSKARLLELNRQLAKITISEWKAAK